MLRYGLKAFSHRLAYRSFASNLKDYPIDGFFNANTYAIVGASDKQGSLGYIIADNFRKSFKGGELFGRKVYKSIMDVKKPVEGGVVVVSAKYAVESCKELMQNGAKWITVITGGFAEAKSAEGKEAQAEILRLANEYKCRIIGPNCMGVYDPHSVDTMFLPDVGLAKPAFGPVGVFSQSGALGVTLLNELAGRDKDSWISKFMSFGNASDVDEVDALKYYATEPSILQIWSYLEGFHNAADFIRLLKDVTTKKPVLILKANRGAAGAKASASHSASLAADDGVCDQLLKNSGAIRCDVWKDMYNIGSALRNQPLPKGRRVAVVTDAGGMGVLIADAIDQYNMKLVDFSEETTKKFRQMFPPYYQCANPMDLTGSATTNDMISAAKLALEDSNIDSVIFSLQPIAPGLAAPTELAHTLVKEFKKTTKPFIVVEFGGKYPDDQTIRSILKEGGLSVFSGAEAGVRVLSKLAGYTDYLNSRSFVQTPTHPAVDIKGVNSHVDRVLNKGRHVLTEVEGYDVLNLCGIATPEYSLFTKGKDAADFVAKSLSNRKKRFVAKVVSPDILHKTEVGGVRLGLTSPEEVLEAVNSMNSKFSKQSIEYHGIMVCEMVASGLEMMIGANRDPSFGPITVSGFGGTMVEVLRDVVFNSCPAPVEEVILSLKNLKNATLLNGFRGKPALNHALFARYTSIISQIMAQCDKIAEIDINPLIQAADGTMTAVDSVFTLKK